jgi:glycosyltransferase involved in cell wall biosynthesis
MKNLLYLLFIFSFQNSKIIPKVSIIVPIYNVQRYIIECLNNLINLTSKEIEIILINDGSTDNTFNRLKSYLEDKKIIFIEQTHQGVANARNTGLDFVMGEYIAFVDSDDYIEENMLEITYNLAKKDNIDIIEFKHTIFQRKRREKPIENNQTEIGIIYNIKNIWQNIRVELWNKLYKSEIIKKNNIKFLPEIYGEDLCFNLMLFPRINLVKKLNSTFYHYRRRKGQITLKLKNNEKWEKMKNILYIIPEYWRKNNLMKGNELWLLEIIINIFILRGKDRYDYAEDFFNIINKQTDFFNDEIINKLNEDYKKELNTIKSNLSIFDL